MHYSNSTIRFICRKLPIRGIIDNQFIRTANVGIEVDYHGSGDDYNYDEFEESSDALYEYHDGYQDANEHDDYYPEDPEEQAQATEPGEADEDYDPEKHEAVEDMLQPSQLEAMVFRKDRIWTFFQEDRKLKL